MPIVRAPNNPILMPSQIEPLWPQHEIIGVFNAAVNRVGADIFLLLRVAERPLQDDPHHIKTRVYDPVRRTFQILSFDRRNPQVDLTDLRLIQRPTHNLLTSMSYLRLARSRDGIHFDVEDKAALAPANLYETYGLEDPRWVQIRDRHYLTYVAVSRCGIVTGLAASEDGCHWQRQGLIFGPENKDVVLFPEKIDGYYYALHRPASPFSRRHEMWLARSPDLLHWGDHRHVMGVGTQGWDAVKIGAGAPPFRTADGWTAIYHGVDADGRYSLGAVLLDHHRPWRVLARSRTALLSPETPYECDGFWGQVVFTCGLLFEQNRLKLYYGAADRSLAYAEVDLVDVQKTWESIV